MTTKIVGHRGAAAVEPENTLVSFRRAIADGADLLECDVHLSADGHLVIMHDTSIDRTAAEDSPRRSGAIADLTRTELDEVLLPGGNHVPSLDEVLDVATGSGIPIFVEVKAPAAAEKTARLLIERGLAVGADDPDSAPAWIISFNADALRTARRVAPDVPLSAITSHVDQEFWDAAAEVDAQAASLQIKTLTDQEVQAARERGLRLNLWTIRNVEQFHRASAAGAETITVDDPAWARSLLEGAPIAG